jgi:hypothetical protein
MNPTMKAIWWLPRIFAAVGFALLLWASGLYTKEHAFVGRATHTNGTVVDLSYSPSSRGGSFYPVFRFTDVRGQPFTVRSHLGSRPASRHVGEVVPVLYDPANPDGARIASFANLYLATSITTVLGLIFGGMGALWLFLVHRADARAEELRHSGVKIQAKVVGIEERRGITVNNRHPWRITAEAQEPARAGQVFRSANIWMDPTPYVKDTVDVFVDRNDPSKHLIDLGFLPSD